MSRRSAADMRWARALQPFVKAERRAWAARSAAVPPPWSPFNQTHKMLSVSVPNAVADQVEAICKERGISRAEYMRLLIVKDTESP